MERNYYVYTHHRASDGSIFYVGKGKGPRSNVVFGRSRHWQRVVNKQGLEVQIVASGLTSHCACSFERAIIASLDRTKLVNLTGGGEGAFDLSPEAREKMRLAKLGRKQSPEHAQKSRTNKIGKKQPLSARLATSRIKSVAIVSSLGERFSSVTAAAKHFGASQGNISMCLAGKRKTTAGRGWAYA